MEGYEIGPMERAMQERELETPGVPFNLFGNPYTCRHCGGLLALYRDPGQQNIKADAAVFQICKHDVCPSAA